MSTFDVREVFKYALTIEQNGYNFYTYMAERLEDLAVKQLFKHLAAEEIKHKQTFNAMLENIKEHQPAEAPPTEYFDYLRAYTETSVFQQSLSTREMEKLADVNAAVQYSIEREADSILYYHEIKAFVPASEHDMIDQIIQEERKHYVKLSEFAKKLK